LQFQGRKLFPDPGNIKWFALRALHDWCAHFLVAAAKRAISPSR
jgi:hypothetical protein